MSLLFDQNLSRRLVKQLADVFPNSEHVTSANLSGAADSAIWSYANSKGHAVVSKDADFQVLSRTLGSPPKVIWLRVGNGPTREIESLLRTRATDIETFSKDAAQSLLELP